MLDADDASLRATVALRLAILQADFQGDYRKSCQVLSSSRAMFRVFGRKHRVLWEKNACKSRLKYDELNFDASTSWACFME